MRVSHEHTGCEEELQKIKERLRDDNRSRMTRAIFSVPVLSIPKTCYLSSSHYFSPFHSPKTRYLSLLLSFFGPCCHIKYVLYRVPFAAIHDMTCISKESERGMTRPLQEYATALLVFPIHIHRWFRTDSSYIRTYRLCLANKRCLLLLHLYLHTHIRVCAYASECLLFQDRE